MKSLKIKYLLLIVLFSIQGMNAQENQSKASIRYQFNFNGTIDKSIVTRLLLISNNRMTIENNWTRFEPILNYKFGYVTPNGRPKTKLENDFFIQLENHFAPKNKLFLSVIAGFENSPNLRQLDSRMIGGLGIGTAIFNKKNNFLQLNVYGLYDDSQYKEGDNKTMRIMPSIKGRFTYNKVGMVYNASFAQSIEESGDQRIRYFIKPYLKLAKHVDLNVMYDFWNESFVSGTSPKQISTFTFGISFNNL
jgi:hypothetical protein